MWPTIGFFLISTLGGEADAQAAQIVFQQPPATEVSWQAAGDAANVAANDCDDGCCPRGDFLAGPFVSDSYWDATGIRSPTDWIHGYGPESHLAAARLEWLLWFSRGRNAPVLARISDASGTVIGEYPNEPIGLDMRNGARVTIGRNIANSATWLAGRFWGIEDGSEKFAIQSPADVPIITRPVTNPSTGLPVSDLVTFPGLVTNGGINVLSKNDLIGADAWLRRTWWNDGRHRLDILAGYQFARMDDSLTIRTSGTFDVPVGVFPAGTIGNLRDSFGAQNEFHAGTLGVVFQHRCHWLSFEALGKVGLGDMRQEVTISGQTTRRLPNGSTVTRNSGTLVFPSNAGTYQRHRFAVAPELNLNGVVHLSPRWQLIAGYSIIYWSNAVLAGNQIDTRVNFTQAPPGPVIGPLLPRFAFNRSDFLVQGINLGAEYRW